MKKTIGIYALVLLLLSTPALAAKNGAEQGAGAQQGQTGQMQQQTDTTPETTGNQVQNQNQVQTQNQGEDTQLQINTQEQESLSAGEEEQGATQGKPEEGAARSETALENMSETAQKVEELLTDDTMPSGIGQQVKAIAQEQKIAQAETKANLNKVDNRNRLVKALMGPDYKALKKMQKQMEQNQQRIQQLTELQNQLMNEGDTTKVQEMIQALTEQNTALQNKVNFEEHAGSLLGWFFRLFAK